MWSDELDKKLQDASGEQNPPFDEKAWDKMELLLDKHLPRKKKRRGLIFLLAFLAVGGTAAFFTLQNSRHSALKPVAQETRQDAPASPPSSQLKSGKAGSTPTIVAGPEIKPERSTEATISQNDSPVNGPANNPQSATAANVAGQANKNNFRDRSVSSQYAAETTHLPRKNKPGKNKVIADMPADKEKDPIATNTSATAPALPPAIPGQDMTIVKTAIPTDTSVTTKADTAQALAVNAQVKKPGAIKKPAGSKFSLLFSFGPDISSVGVNTGRIKMQAGLGLGYALSKRLSVRTGFYVSRKVYSADSSDYHPPKGFGNYYPNLEEVDANCLVYEIPVSVMYHFAEGGKHDWFVSGGLSSYIMKKEKYGISYKDTWGSAQYHDISLSNQNKHIFSVINLSGGYRYNFTDRFFLMAEPYVKIPVGGVGFGKVKLNSGGVLFTIGLKPFLRKN